MIRKIWKILYRSVLVFIIITCVVVIIFRFLPIPSSSFILQNKFANLLSASNDPVHYDWISIDEVSDDFKLSLIAAEDQKFVSHFGFDFEEIQNALFENKRKGRKRGASTITQQTAKNLFLWSDKSYFRKGIEAYFTILLELFWTKERILEVYMNIAEFGTNIYGVKSAAKKYYKVDPIKLTPRQSSLLAAILPNPKRFLIQSPTLNQQRRAAWVQLQMKQLGHGILAEL